LSEPEEDPGVKTTSTFYDRLLSDHRKTEALLMELSVLIREGKAWEDIEGLYHTLITELECHFAGEEYGLFPVLSQYKTMVLMEVEHEDLLEAQERFYEALCQSQKAKTATENLNPLFEEFQDMLLCHIKEEEQGIFPMAEECLEPEEKALVQRKLEEAYTLITSGQSGAEFLERAKPTCQITHHDFFGTPGKPKQYHKLFGAEHASVHHIQLQAGESFKTHWAPEHQCLLVIQGEVVLRTETEEYSLATGDQVTMTPRFPFALLAKQDSHLLAIKVWPRPHFIRKPQPSS
jgi:quercetin dioxygenase-like cupin family protein/hemerythrin